MKIPVQIDLVLVLVANILSHFAKFQDNLGVKIVGNIPSGFQAPTVPRFQNVGGLLSDSFVMAILILSITITLAKLTANKHGIRIDDNQELLAYGAGNLFSSFFGCCPAPSRTMVLSSLGAQFTLNCIPTAVSFLLVILLIGQLFVSLPMAVLAAMIIASMKDLLLQYRNLPRIWRINKYDFIIWVSTNSFTILLDLPYGLMVGIIISLLLVVVQNQQTSGHLVDTTSGDMQNHTSGIAVFPCNVYFATAERFQSQLYGNTINPQLYKKQEAKLQKQRASNRASDTDDVFICINESNRNQFSSYKPESVIIDMSMVGYVDMAGCNVLQLVVKEFLSIGVSVYLVGLTENPRKTMKASGLFEQLSDEFVFSSVNAAMKVIDTFTESSFSS